VNQKKLQAESKCEYIMNMINAKYISSNDRFLDIGCAAGFFLSATQKRGFKSYGIEISKEGSNFAKEKFGINILADDLLNLSREYEEYFDFISMFHVLEHLNDPNMYLKKIYRILKPGGHLIIEVPNIKSIDRFFSINLIRTLQPPQHLYVFDYNNLSKILKENGFIIVIKEVYFSNVIGELLKKTLYFFKKNKLFISDKEDKQSCVKKNHYHINIIRNMARLVFPGMNMLFIVRKPK
jgi:2-polyprenyl-3-methyl-5-hydroxy-6-metoxy-1,4-benzoquinol methylase